jgi:hypothetical protein
MAEDSLVAKSLKEKCVSAKVKLIVGNIEDLHDIWSTLDISQEVFHGGATTYCELQKMQGF